MSHVTDNEKQHLSLSDSLRQPDVSMTRRNIQGLQAGKGRVALQKLPLQISRLDVVSSTSCVCPTQFLATTKDWLASTSEIGATSIQNVNLVPFYETLHFSLWKWTESTSHHGGLRGKYRLEETFARVKMDHDKERKRIILCLPFLTTQIFFYYSIVDLQCYISFGCTAKWFSYTYIYCF